MEKIFKIRQRGSNILQELLSGFIVFLAMIYILPVNSSILAAGGGNEGAVFIATALTSGICCFIMGLYANLPIALSAGMGLNAYLAFTVCTSLGYSFNEGLFLVFVSGILFLILSLTPLREKLINAIPKSLKYAVSAGLGAFICFVGLKMSGIIKADSSTLVTLGDFNNPPVLLALFGILLTLVLMQIKGKIGKLAIVISMFITAIIGLILGLCNVSGMPKLVWSNTFSNYKVFFQNVGKCFSDDTFKVLLKPESYAVIFSLIFVNLFDTTATLIAVGDKVGVFDENNNMIGGKKAIIADAIGAFICAPLGTSTVTSFAESTVGAESGAKTGLSACMTGLLFILSTFLYPLFSIFAGVEGGYTPITSLALVAVGCLMFSNLKNIDWDDSIIVITTFLIVILMVLCYSVSDGLGLGMIAYCLMMIIAKRYKEVPLPIYIITVFFIINYVVKVIIS